MKSQEELFYIVEKYFWLKNINLFNSLVCQLVSLSAMIINYDLCIITEEVPAKGLTHLKLARRALDGGATIIQFREKQKSARECLEIALALKKLCREAGAAFIVNDRLDIALLCEADGVHLGQEDLPAALAKKVLQEKKSPMLLGVSSHSVEQAKKAKAEGADYLGFGPIYSTISKETGYRPLGPEAITRIKKEVNLPLLAISGIKPDNALECLRAGADGIAVISAVSRAPDPEEAVRSLREIVRQAKNIW